MMGKVFDADVAKDRIEVVGPDGYARANNDDLKAFALCAGKQGGRVAFEALDGYETRLRTALGNAGLPAFRINPRPVRAFATLLGRSPRTNRVDAHGIRAAGTAGMPAGTQKDMPTQNLVVAARQCNEDPKTREDPPGSDI